MKDIKFMCWHNGSWYVTMLTCMRHMLSSLTLFYREVQRVNRDQMSFQRCCLHRNGTENIMFQAMAVSCCGCGQHRCITTQAVINWGLPFTFLKESLLNMQAGFLGLTRCMWRWMDYTMGLWVTGSGTKSSVWRELMFIVWSHRAQLKDTK